LGVAVFARLKAPRAMRRLRAERYFFAFSRAISDAGSVDGARFIGSAPVG
jgi:hypothetical protein